MFLSTSRVVALVIAAGSLVVSRASAQSPVFSMGAPLQWQPHAGLFATNGGGGATLGLYHPILNPITGLLGASAEAFGAVEHSRGVGGLRLLASAPAVGVLAGVNWRATDGDFDPLLGFRTAVRRGGLLTHGTMLRLNWLPTRHTFDVGVDIPLRQPFAGRTRPRTTMVSSPRVELSDARDATLSDAAERAMATVAGDAALLGAYASLYSEDDQRALKTSGRSFEAVARSYHDALVAAFGDRRVADRARAGALAHVVLPYDALFGQVKDDETLGAFVVRAHDDFARWLRDSSKVGAAAMTNALAVEGRWLRIIQDRARQQLREWNDTRLVWLPPQLALTPERAGRQTEIDALIGTAVGQTFSDRNALQYFRTSDLVVEIARSILAAQRYHVLWTHDFPGRRDDTGSLDEIAYTIVADAYLPALTKAVARYDSTGTLPEYIILFDAFYYHGRDGALWMNVLRDPLNARVHLRADEQTQADHLEKRLDELRAAVDKSARLQREAAEHGGMSWLRQVVRVNVNVTLPSDFSFRSARTMPPFPFTPDNIMRDHRKIVLYDFTETEPNQGGLLVTGIGIGEHYASATWEDRGYEVRGPAALEARRAVRRALMSNGFTPEQMPPALRSTDGSLAGDVVPTTDGFSPGRVLQLHNDAGFGTKAASVGRAMLYSLAPAGSMIVVPDPLWLSDTWAALLAGAAARGCHVVIIAPALENAPSPQAPVIVLERDVLYRLIAIRDELHERIAASGGSLHVGLFAAHAPITDVAGRLREVHAGLARAPWIRELIPLEPRTIALLDSAYAGAQSADRTATAIAQDEKKRLPQLHQKTVLVARTGAVASLVHRPAWATAIAGVIRSQARQTARLAVSIERAAAVSDTAVDRATEALFEDYERSVPMAERERFGFYFTVGSQNHDPRGLMLDGEATVIVSGVQASIGLVDLFYLMARTTWVQTNSEVDQLVPPPRGLFARLARLIRFGM